MTSKEDPATRSRALKEAKVGDFARWVVWAFETQGKPRKPKGNWKSPLVEFDSSNRFILVV